MMALLPFPLFLIIIIIIHHLLPHSSCTTTNAIPSSPSVSNSANDQRHRRLKVLVYSPSFGWSHMQFLGKIADTLAEANHEVHYVKLLANPMYNDRNETKLVHKVYRVKPKFVTHEKLDLSAQMEITREPFSGKHFSTTKLLTDRSWDEFMGVAVHCCREIISNEQLLVELTKEKFDLAIAEMYEQCPFVFFHRIGVRTKFGALAIPLIQGVARDFGIPTFSSFVPNFDPPLNAPYMTFLERAMNFYGDLYDWLVLEQKSVQLLGPLIESTFGPAFLPLEQHMRNISLLFVNSNPFLEFPRPLSNKLVYIGGLVDQKVGKLDERTKRILDGSTRPGGAVLVSFGSLSDTTKMSAQMRRAMVSAFAEFTEFEFIWKLDTSHELLFHDKNGNNNNNTKALFASAANVHVFDWFDQNAILRHPKLRAFVSHCGQNSLTEAARAGVPIIAIPLFGDQLYNAVLAKYKGMGVYVDVKELNDQEQIAKEIMKEALNKVLYDPFYRSNAQLIKRKMSSIPFSPKEQLVRWVEFASEFTDLNELNLPGNNELHWFVYYSLDVILFSVVVCSLTALAIVLLLLKTARLIWRIITCAIRKNLKMTMPLKNDELKKRI